MPVILVHGLWGVGEHWKGVVEALKSLDIKDVSTVELPLESLKGDVDVVREAVKKADGPVLLVGQGYAGAVITEAGTEDAVKGLVYVCALAPDAGESSGSCVASHPNSIKDSMEVVDGKLRINDANFHANYCADLPDELAAWLRKTGRNPIPVVMGENVSEAAWKTKPSYYVVSEADKCVVPEGQEYLAERMDAVRLTRIAGASHAVHVSNPGEVGLFIAGAAKNCKVV